MKNKTLNVEPFQFIKISTPETAYILGFLWADGYLGCNYSINIEITSKDANIIKKIFLSTGKWHIFQRTRKHWKPQTKICCNSKVLYNHLIKLGFNNKNKNPNKILNIIPKKLHHYWFRGYFDGDGCWYFNPKQYLRQCIISSKYNQNWNFMIKLLNKLKISKYSLDKIKYINKQDIENKHSRLRLSNLDSIKKFGNYLYNGNQFGLKRKLQKFNEIIL